VGEGYDPPSDAAKGAAGDREGVEGMGERFANYEDAGRR